MFIKNLLEKDIYFTQKLHIKNKKSPLGYLASFFAHSGDSWYWLAALLLVWMFNRSVWHQISAYLAVTILIQAILVLIIKFLIKRSRPSGEWGTIYRNSDPHSFPSGHATRAVMLAVIFIFLKLTPIYFLMPLWAIFVSFARVSLGVHYLSDIIAGWILGLVLGFLMILAQPLLIQFVSRFLLS